MSFIARYVYSYDEFVLVAEVHSATEWQWQDKIIKIIIYKLEFFLMYMCYVQIWNVNKF